MRHFVFFVAILVMAACDGSTGERDDLVPVGDTVSDMSDSVKGDDPYPPEDTYNPPEVQEEVFPPLTAETVCPSLLSITGVWWCVSDNELIDGDRLEVIVQISTTEQGQCDLTFTGEYFGTWHFTGKTLPLSVQYKGGIHDWTAYLYTEGNALILQEVRADRPDAPMRTEFYQ